MDAETGQLVGTRNGVAIRLVRGELAPPPSGPCPSAQ
jgi:hypothetical protein